MACLRKSILSFMFALAASSESASLISRVNDDLFFGFISPCHSLKTKTCRERLTSHALRLQRWFRPSASREICSAEFAIVTALT